MWTEGSVIQVRIVERYTFTVSVDSEVRTKGLRVKLEPHIDIAQLRKHWNGFGWRCSISWGCFTWILHYSMRIVKRLSEFTLDVASESELSKLLILFVIIDSCISEISFFSIEPHPCDSFQITKQCRLHPAFKIWTRFKMYHRIRFWMINCLQFFRLVTWMNDLLSRVVLPPVALIARLLLLLLYELSFRWYTSRICLRRWSHIDILLLYLYVHDNIWWCSKYIRLCGGRS